MAAAWAGRGDRAAGAGFAAALLDGGAGGGKVMGTMLTRSGGGAAVGGCCAAFKANSASACNSRLAAMASGRRGSGEGRGTVSVLISVN